MPRGAAQAALRNGYVGGAAFISDPIVALLVSLAIGTGISAMVEMARRSRAPAPTATVRSRELTLAA